MYNQQRRKYESNSTSRMEKTGRTYPSSGTRDHSRITKVWIHNRIYTGARGPAGRQIDDTVQRPGASATRRSSSPEQPQKHAACRARKNHILEIITLRAPSWGLATSHPSQATSLKRQATSVKLQATSRKLQAFKIIIDKI
jgi:hypothetical protein